MSVDYRSPGREYHAPRRSPFAGEQRDELCSECGTLCRPLRLCECCVADHEPEAGCELGLSLDSRAMVVSCPACSAARARSRGA